MSVEFETSQTCKNLMRAFAGESQARNRYTFSAAQAKKENQIVIAGIFDFTAAQELQHAKVFYHFLKDMAGETIHIDGGYPVDISRDLGTLLRMAAHNEFEEYDHVYQSFGETAVSEGFDKIGNTFFNIARIEASHGRRFETLARLHQEKRLFVSDIDVRWLCLKCGYIYEGKEPPKKCPVCGHDYGYFMRLNLFES